MAYGRVTQQYLQTEVRSRTPLELVVMLYDGAQQACSVALDAMTRRDIAARRDAVSRAMAIIAELQSTLDMERGGDVATQLDRLYSWMTTQLLEATVRQHPKPIHEVRRILGILHGAWREIAVKGVPESAA